MTLINILRKRPVPAGTFQNRACSLFFSSSRRIFKTFSSITASTLPKNGPKRKGPHTGRHACVVIPTYNEQENIQPLIHALADVSQKIPDWQIDILIVDDNSPDNTADIVRELQKSSPRLHLITGEKKGLGDAYLRGFNYVLRHLSADYLIQMDADLQHNPQDIGRFLQKAAEGYEFIIGSRYIEHSNSRLRLKRKLYSWIANRIARHIAGISDVRDCTSGFRCISSKFLKSFDLATLKSNGYAFQMSLLHAAHVKPIRILEIPIHFSNRKKGASKLGLADMIEFFIDAIKLRYKKYRWHD